MFGKCASGWNLRAERVGEKVWGISGESGGQLCRSGAHSGEEGLTLKGGVCVWSECGWRGEGNIDADEGDPAASEAEGDEISGGAELEGSKRAYRISSSGGDARGEGEEEADGDVAELGRIFACGALVDVHRCVDRPYK